MADRWFDLATVLDPIPPARFLDTFWEHRPLIVHRERPDYYRGLFAIRDVDAVLAVSHDLPSEVRLANHHRQAQGQALEAIGGNDGTVDAYKAYNAYRDGTTLIVNNLQHRWPPVGALARQLALDLSCTVGVNAYLTPHDAQGFQCHRDDHDVLVLQLEGSKLWHLYEAGGVPLTLPGAGGEADVETLGAATEVLLGAGDLLYVPRGMAHQAIATEEPSLHLTVGLYPALVKDLLEQAIAVAAERDQELRKAVAGSALWDDQQLEALQASLAESLDRVRQQAPAARVRERLRGDHLSRLRPLPDGHFAQLGRNQTIAADTPMRWRRGMRVQVLEREEQAVIAFAGNEVSGPAFIAPALAFVAENRRFRPDQLPDVLDPPSKLVLVRRLHREGLLAIDDAPAADGDGD